MKRIIYTIIFLAVFGFGLWLFFRQSEPAQKQSDLPPPQIQTRNVQIQPQMLTTVAPTNNANLLTRPNSVDEQTWNKWISYRQIVLGQNQPVEFYARVLDEKEQPVFGATLKLKLTRWSEDEFSMTNFPHWDPTKAVQENKIDLLSDKNGWLQVTGTNGSFLDMTELSKEGYLSSYPNGIFGGVHYEAGGVRNTYGGDIQLTNALIPLNGYILHLQKIDGK